MRQRVFVIYCALIGGFTVALSTFGAGSASAATTCYGTPRKIGSNGTCVRYIQQMLNGIYAEVRTVNNGGRLYQGGGLIAVDGAYGSATAAQVRTFQRYAALSVTGRVTPGTGIWNKLCAYAVNGESFSQRSGSSHMDSVMRAGVSAGIDAKCPRYQTESKLVSLGGSIAAGLGIKPPLHSLQNGQSATAGSARKCGRTEGSFAYILSKIKGLQLIQAACSGATSERVRGTELTETKEDIKGNLVFLTFTGANDIGWINKQTACLTKGCKTIPGAYNADGSPAIPTAKLHRLTANLRYILKTIHHEGAKRIIVDQYYAVTQGDPFCLKNSPFSKSDYAWMTAELRALNAAIKAGVTETKVGAKLVKPNFNGHGICEPHPWVAFPGFGAGAAEHPTAAGQRYLARLNKAAL